MLKASLNKTAQDGAIDSNYLQTTQVRFKVVSETVGTKFADTAQIRLGTSQPCTERDSLWLFIVHKILAALPADDDYLDPPISGYFPTVPTGRYNSIRRS